MLNKSLIARWASRNSLAFRLVFDSSTLRMELAKLSGGEIVTLNRIRYVKR